MKIFIIEDEPAIREELVQLLQKYGYQCDSSDDFHHIVQAALSSGANLILLDINLPYQDGFHEITVMAGDRIGLWKMPVYQ